MASTYQRLVQFRTCGAISTPIALALRAFLSAEASSRLPLIGDPLRRIHLPEDLDAVTTIGAEADPESLGVSRDAVERMLGRGTGPL